MMNVKLAGVDKLIRELKKTSTKVQIAARAALYQEGEGVSRLSAGRYVPIDLGNLKSSRKVDKPKSIGGFLVVKITYGGAAAPYALAVHEHPSPASPPSWRGKSISSILSVRGRKAWSLSGRGPKYLERAIKDLGPRMDERMAAIIRRMAL